MGGDLELAKFFGADSNSKRVCCPEVVGSKHPVLEVAMKMHWIGAVMMALFASSAVVGCGGDDDESGKYGALCIKGCAATGQLNCPGDNPETCVSDCEEQASQAAACRSEFDAAANCLADRPTSDWQCDAETGESTPKAGVCDAETTALVVCLVGG